MAFSEIIEKKIFPDAEVADGININAVCSRLEVADDVILVKVYKLSGLSCCEFVSC